MPRYPAGDAIPSVVTVNYWQPALPGYEMLISFTCYWSAVKTFKYDKATPLHYVGKEASSTVINWNCCSKGGNSTSVWHITRDYCPFQEDFSGYRQRQQRSLVAWAIACEDQSRRCHAAVLLIFWTPCMRAQISECSPSLKKIQQPEQKGSTDVITGVNINLCNIWRDTALSELLWISFNIFLNPF